MPDSAVPPRRAASVLLLRDSPGGPEVFVLSRVAQMAFAAGMTVFPGGGVAPGDAELVADLRGWDEIWQDPDTGATVVAAVRELLEEVGVALFAGPDGSSPPVDAGLRRDLAGHRRTLAEVLAATGSKLRADWLVPVGRWITPVGAPIRYDTFFYAARLPVGSRADARTSEADAGRWARPQDLLTAATAGALRLMPPTRALLERLATFDTAGQALAAPWPLAPVLPRIVSGPGQPLRVEVPAP